MSIRMSHTSQREILLLVMLCWSAGAIYEWGGETCSSLEQKSSQIRGSKSFHHKSFYDLLSFLLSNFAMTYGFKFKATSATRSLSFLYILHSYILYLV